MGYAFISYSSKNKTSADAMRNLLIEHNIDMWMAPHDIPAGSEYLDVICNAVEHCSCLVLMLTGNSQESEWVKSELNLAISSKKIIIPVMVEDVELNSSMKVCLIGRQIVPVHDINEDSEEMQKVLRSVLAATGKTEKNASPQSIQTVASTSTKEINLTIWSPVNVEVFLNDKSHPVMIVDNNSSFDHASNIINVSGEFELIFVSKGFEKRVAFDSASVEKELRYKLEPILNKKEIKASYDRAEAIEQLEEEPTAYAYRQLSVVGTEDDISLLIDSLTKLVLSAMADSNTDCLIANCVSALGKLAVKYGAVADVKMILEVYEIYESKDSYGYMFEPIVSKLKAEGYSLETGDYWYGMDDMSETKTEPDVIRDFNSYFVRVCNKFGQEIDWFENEKNCEQWYLKAVAISEILAFKNNKSFSFDLAYSYCNLGLFYDNCDNLQGAEKYYLKALAEFEKLTTENLGCIIPEYVRCLEYVADFYDRKRKQLKKAEKYYIEAVGLWGHLVTLNPEKFNHSLAKCCGYLGKFYEDQEKSQEAVEYYLKSIKIYEKIVTEKPDTYESILACYYLDIAELYEEHKQIDKAEEYYLKAIAIREKLAGINPELDNPDLAGNYNKVCLFYIRQEKRDKAEKYCLKEIATWEKHVAEWPKLYYPRLADGYYNAGEIYRYRDEKKAEEYYLKSIEIYEKLVLKNPEGCNPDLARCYYTYALFKGGNEALFKKAYDIAVLYLDDSICRMIIDDLSEYFGN